MSLSCGNLKVTVVFGPPSNRDVGKELKRSIRYRQLESAVKNLSTALVALVIAVGSSHAAAAQTFDFTHAQFIDKLNAQLRQDGGDTTKTCKNNGRDTTCIFNDAHFQQSVVEFKKLNLANGGFTLKEKLIVSETNGKVSLIIIEGDRAEPINLFHFVGQLGSSLSTLNPSLSTDDMTKEMLSLGVMRGDDDTSIGHPKMDILDSVQVTCNNQKSSVTTKIGCALVPRS
jgi:hypothetical protein